MRYATLNCVSSKWDAAGKWTPHFTVHASDGGVVGLVTPGRVFDTADEAEMWADAVISHFNKNQKWPSFSTFTGKET